MSSGSKPPDHLSLASIASLMKVSLDQFLSRLSPRKRELARLHAKWGRSGDNDGWSASRYFDLTRDRGAGLHVDDKTWDDLEFPKLFSDVDSTETDVGGQVLYRKLREYVDERSELEQQYAAYRTLRSSASLREEIQLRLAALRASSCGDIADFVFGQPPERPKYHFYITAWSLFSIATLAGVIAGLVPAALWLGVISANIAIIFGGFSSMSRDLETIKKCYALLRVADSLASIPHVKQTVPQVKRLVEDTSRRATAKKAIQLLYFRGDELIQSLYAWLNVVFLLEQVAYFRIVDRFVEVRPEIASAFEMVGSLDADIAISSYLEMHPHHCKPEVVDEQLIDIASGYHPLIEQPVKNSMRLAARSALITGSNMAGKTTFIKMVGINVILGRTVGFCFAQKAIIPSSGVMGSIRSDHSVESGKSHYFTQVEAIQSFIEKAKQGACSVFVIDELFSGTNTVERLAASRAVLESISRYAQVFVTTHDIELQSMLANSYDLYHFQEDPDVEGFFDYQLRPGPTGTRNAIRLLHRLGFPDDIVTSAMNYADQNSRDSKTE